MLIVKQDEKEDESFETGAMCNTSCLDETFICQSVVKVSTESVLGSSVAEKSIFTTLLYTSARMYPLVEPALVDEYSLLKKRLFSAVRVKHTDKLSWQANPIMALTRGS